jgi:hypothetical protein
VITGADKVAEDSPPRETPIYRSPMFRALSFIKWVVWWLATLFTITAVLSTFVRIPGGSNMLFTAAFTCWWQMALIHAMLHKLEQR